MARSVESLSHGRLDRTGKLADSFITVSLSIIFHSLLGSLLSKIYFLVIESICVCFCLWVQVPVESTIACQIPWRWSL